MFSVRCVITLLTTTTILRSTTATGILQVRTLFETSRRQNYRIRYFVHNQTRYLLTSTIRQVPRVTRNTLRGYAKMHLHICDPHANQTYLHESHLYTIPTTLVRCFLMPPLEPRALPGVPSALSSPMSNLDS
ncbi:hypothetical protein F5Y12DRAFT_401717 [Xylaria sp. FL1777]|nr:hypothetical protein F5Y12DRAFT_401717 [Xylaria sp. FL1777]